MLGPELHVSLWEAMALVDLWPGWSISVYLWTVGVRLPVPTDLGGGASTGNTVSV